MSIGRASCPVTGCDRPRHVTVSGHRRAYCRLHYNAYHNAYYHARRGHLGKVYTPRVVRDDDGYDAYLSAQLRAGAPFDALLSYDEWVTVSWTRGGE